LQDANEHLGRSVLIKLLDELRQREDHKELNLAQIHPHLTQCQACCEQLEAMAIEGGWGNIRVTWPEAPQVGCPNDETWDEVAGGLVEPDQTLIYIEHASRCDHCGPLLRNAVERFVDPNLDIAKELTEAERARVESLESSRPEWQMRLAERISGTARSSRQLAPWWRRRSLAPVLAGATLTALLVAGVSWWQWDSRKTPEGANRLLARAYTDQRTLELRFPGAAYGPLRVQRGPAESFTARPAPLLKAEALIASQLAARPDDPAWLQAAAQADVLEGKYDAAVEALQRALELEPHSADVMFDLATAHFQRAQSEDRQEDYAAAYEFLSDVLAQQPQNAPALFNRAIVAEHQFLYQQALDDWEHYLKLDSTSQWAEEARNRADAVRAKLKEHESGVRPLLTPDQIVGSADSEVERRVEQYLDAAVTSWLPLAYPEHGPDDPNAQRALFFLADLTAQNHKDRWLADLLAGASDPRFPKAAAALASASNANNSGDYTVGRERGTIALELFRASGSQAGVLRAKFEQVYAEQLTRRSDDCRRDAASALKQAETVPYPWLQIQLGLEKGVCSGLMDDWGTYELTSRHSMDRAQASGYDGLHLRALAFLADEQIQTGNRSTGLKSVHDGLNRYWSSPQPAKHAYNLYYALGLEPETASGMGNFELAIWREAAALADSDNDFLVRAWAHNYAARAAASARQPKMAQVEYAEADRLFTLAPQTEASRGYVLENEIRTAELDARLAQFNSGIVRLTKVQDQLPPSNKYLAQMFYSTLGELQLRRHHGTQAEQAFRPALELAEQRLISLNSESERVNWRKDAAPVYLGMVEAEFLEGRTYESLDCFEWYLGAAARARSANTTYGRSTPDATWLASRLPLLTDRTVLAYAVLPDGLAIWIYDNRGVNGHWIPGAGQDLQELAARFYDLASDPKSEMAALRRDSQSLYRALIVPVEQQLDPGRTLVIEADGWIGRVPFEALLDSDGHYLIERTPVVHSLGQYTEASLHEDVPISSSSHALVVGSTASSQSDGLVPLPDVVAEADTVANNFNSSRLLKASEATLSAVESELPAAQVFHFTGHSLITPNGAALLLAAATSGKTGSDLLNADRVRQFDLRQMQLAFLSTCNTESGNDGVRGFGNFAEALQRAGVPHLVASRWEVDSVETRKFVEGFYRGLLSGESISQAVRQQARSMMLNPYTAHPYYWSAFSAYGRS
jgi:CHAT domain-containing protein/cytochrome c-type biogenesis protein CcmH/NrfG